MADYVDYCVHKIWKNYGKGMDFKEYMSYRSSWVALFEYMYEAAEINDFDDIKCIVNSIEAEMNEFDDIKCIVD